MTVPRDPLAQLAHARHELRTPIGAMIGYSEMILEEPEHLDAATIGMLEGFLEKSRSLLSDMQDLLGHSRLETQGSTLKQMGNDARARLLPIAEEMQRQSIQLLELGKQTDAAGDFHRILDACRLFRVMLDRELAFDSQTTASVVSASPRQADAPDVGPASTSRRPACVFPNDSQAREDAFTGMVLVVDDNAFNREILGRALWKQRHHFAVASGGRQALDMLEQGGFDVVLLDLMMPEMDGFEVLARIKGNANLRDIPVIMVSALDQMEGIVRCIEMGAEDYLPKPFDPVLLEARVNACLEKKRLRDLELEYLRNVDGVIQAAAAVESGSFDPVQLDATASRTDALGQLARVFQRMAREVRAREERLKQEVQQLRFEVDEVRKAKQVQEITETDFFQQLQERAEQMRRRSRK